MEKKNIDRETSEAYMRAYMDGYTAAKEGRGQQPYIDKDGIIKRYGGKIGQNKAGEIIRAVRHVCNGGKLNSCSIVLMSELLYWESIVEKKFVERL